MYTVFSNQQVRDRLGVAIGYVDDIGLGSAGDYTLASQQLMHLLLNSGQSHLPWVPGVEAPDPSIINAISATIDFNRGDLFAQLRSNPAYLSWAGISPSELQPVGGYQATQAQTPSQILTATNPSLPPGTTFNTPGGSLVASSSGQLVSTPGSGSPAGTSTGNYTGPDSSPSTTPVVNSLSSLLSGNGLLIGAALVGVYLMFGRGR